MPDAKYFDRPGNGNGKYSLGWDNEDLSSTPPKPAMETPTVSMPSEATQDKPTGQDGGTGKPFFKTLESRRGKADSGSGHDSAGGFGGPNAS